MANPFVAEIRMFGGNFAPTGWATCDGQILSISQNTALFSLLGTTYGGNGQTTFALPNLGGAVPISQGQGAGLSDRVLGEMSGSETVTLLTSEMPIHTHSMMAQNIDPADTNQPAPNVTLGKTTPGAQYLVTNSNIVQMWPTALSASGGSLPHNNMMPFLTVFFIIALQGVFPARP
jgi:microcystin-dependent protein